MSTELEISLVLGQDSLPLDVQVSDLHITHLKDMNPIGLVNGALLATAQSVLEVIAQGFGDAGALNSRLGDLYQRLSNGRICSIRRIEIELLHAGRVSLASPYFEPRLTEDIRIICLRQDSLATSFPRSGGCAIKFTSTMTWGGRGAMSITALASH